MIQDQSESNSERGKDKNFYLSEEAGLTPLLAMTQSFEDCDWLVVQEGSKSAFKSRVYYKGKSHFSVLPLPLPLPPRLTPSPCPSKPSGKR